MANNVYLFIGDEPLLITSKIERIIKNSRADEFNIVKYDGDETSISAIIQDALTPPFMANVKVIVIKNPIFLTNEKSQINHEVKDLIKYLEKPMDTTVLIINAANTKLSEKLDVVKALRQKATVNETKEMDDIEYTGWLKRQCDLEGIQIRDDAAKQFINIVGKNLTAAKNEVDKLVAYVGKGGKITTKEVAEITSKTIQNDVYALTNSILNKEKKKVLHTYTELVTSGHDVMQLMNLVSRTIKDTLITNLYLKNGLKQADIAQKFGVSTNRAYYLVKNAKAFDSEIAEDVVKKLATLDYKIKSGQIDAKAGFEIFLLSL